MTRADGSVVVRAATEGLDARDGGAVEPPDVQIAAGAGWVVEAVNIAARAWHVVNGAPTEPVTLPISTILGSGGDDLSDPRIVYDAPSNRFFLSMLDEVTGSILLAVSRTSDPTGAWKSYSFKTAGCPDQPRVGLDDSVVVLAADIFTSCLDARSRVLGNEVFVINKQQLLDAAAAPAQKTFGPDVRDESLQPVRSLGPTTVEYVVSVDVPVSSTAHLIALTGTPPGPVTFARVADIPVTELDSPPNATQPGTIAGIATNDDRILDAVWSAGKLWATANTGCTPVGDNAERACGRLIGIDTASRALAADSQIASAGGHTFYPALSLDGAGDVVVVYGMSSATVFPEIDAVARTAAGTFTAPVTVAAPGLVHTGRRYGDYFGAGTDPTDPGVVWVAGQIPKVGVPHGWGTEIAGVSVSGAPAQPQRPDTTPPKARAIGSSGRAGTRVKLNYRVSDDRGRTRERVTVLRGKKTLAVLATKLGVVDPSEVYFVDWRAPRSVRGVPLRFCVRATDTAGNTSALSCAALRIR